MYALLHKLRFICSDILELGMVIQRWGTAAIVYIYHLTGLISLDIIIHLLKIELIMNFDTSSVFILIYIYIANISAIKWENPKYEIVQYLLFNFCFINKTNTVQGWKQIPMCLLFFPNFLYCNTTKKIEVKIESFNI